MILPAAILALAAQAAGEEPAEPEPYPARAVLAAFATACSGIEDVEVARASARAAGWKEFEPDAASAIGRIVSLGAGMMAQAAPAVETIDGGVWRRDVAGRELFLVISGVRDPQVSSHGCRLYDLDAPAPIDAEDLRAWAARDPESAALGIPGGVKYVWNPGLKPGHMEMEASFVPQGAALPEPLAGIPLSGLVLTASAVEFSDL